MTAPHSLIRRDAVLALVEKAGLLGDPEDGLRLIANGVLALPADPVGEAAGRFAEAWCSDPHVLGFGQRFRDSVLAYRAAVAARDAGEKR